jgi:aspartate 1-decarboxylase
LRRTLLKSKIHRATVTACDLNYVGSLTIDSELMALADLCEFEFVHVVDVNNGARFQTYAISGQAGSGQLQVNGAAARLVHRGDIVIVFSYAQYAERELPTFAPVIVTVDHENRPVPASEIRDTNVQAQLHTEH